MSWMLSSMYLSTNFNRSTWSRRHRAASGEMVLAKSSSLLATHNSTFHFYLLRIPATYHAKKFFAKPYCLPYKERKTHRTGRHIFLPGAFFGYELKPISHIGFCPLLNSEQSVPASAPTGFPRILLRPGRAGSWRRGHRPSAAPRPGRGRFQCPVGRFGGAGSAG